jgi:hypothetical protein
MSARRRSALGARNTFDERAFLDEDFVDRFVEGTRYVDKRNLVTRCEPCDQLSDRPATAVIAVATRGERREKQKPQLRVHVRRRLASAHEAIRETRAGF